MLSLVCWFAVATQTPSTSWYGPEIVEFPFAFAGNPYDIEKSDIRVKFVDSKGDTVERIAYFDPDSFSWKAVLLANRPGIYKATLIRNTIPQVGDADQTTVELETSALPTGFIKVDPINKNRFLRDSGQSYIPLGFNLGWQNPGQPAIADSLKAMGQNGVNWTRIQATAWDGKNPWIPRSGAPDDDRLLPEPLLEWDSIVDSAEKSGVAIQFVLFSHSQFSLKADGTWNSNPWNKANGGFLAEPGDFFTDPEAKRRTKMWLRYAVARWAHHPAIMAWELIDDVDALAAPPAGLVAWHLEMADYLRSIDPYHHLITTGSGQSLNGLSSSLDYYQPRAIAATIGVAVAKTTIQTDKPGFIGSIGTEQAPTSDSRAAIRDSIWTPILSGQSGSAGFNLWSTVLGDDLLPEYAAANRIVKESGLADHPGSRKVDVNVISSSSLQVNAIGQIDWLLMRVKGAGRVVASRLGLSPGNYELTSYALGKNDSQKQEIQIGGITQEIIITIPGDDSVFVFKAK
ncbi:MAG TPA: hypothetical protein VJ835_04820 [Fimbriimonadaceae bacterium]|nr:hypothetical protein [Fimbriimonadaceae bacterium]